MVHSITIIFFMELLIFSSCDEEGPVVQTPLGPILGITGTSRRGASYYSFRGVPYAKSPVGELRFKPPKPVEPWDETFDATEDGPVCYMPITDNFQNCLRLNVYTRRIEEEEYRPVLVFIHGGNFNYLSGRSDYYGPNYMMDYDIVLVTINYRLGALGFFSTGDKYAPGNYGLKDQVEALKWVKKYIKFFGGDANKVTISGENAGAASVGLHLISPMSRDLFHGAIMLSGSATNPWVVNKNPLEIAERFAKSLDCSTENSQTIAECVTRITEENIGFVYGKFFESPIVGRTFSPVIESETDGEKFLEKDPLLSLMEGDIADVPVFIGTAWMEKPTRASDMLSNQQWTKNYFSQNWTTIAPSICLYPPNDTVSQKLREFYFEDMDAITKDKLIDGLKNLLSDALVIFGVIQSAKLISDKNTKPVYLYQYNYDGKNLYSEQYLNLPDVISNSVDIYYVFPSETYFVVKFNTTGVDSDFINKFTTLWKNFVETWNPTPEATESLDNVVWEPYTNENPQYLNINQSLVSMKGMYLKERIALWEKLFPLVLKNN